jgi:hypothetical protein
MDFSQIFSSGIDLSQLPQHLEAFDGMLNAFKKFLPSINDYAKVHFTPEKGNLISVLLVPTNDKIMIYVVEIKKDGNKDYIYKNHWKGEAFEQIENLRKYLPYAKG